MIYIRAPKLQSVSFLRAGDAVHVSWEDVEDEQLKDLRGTIPTQSVAEKSRTKDQSGSEQARE